MRPEDSNEESKPNEKKFYQIETKITFTDGRMKTKGSRLLSGEHPSTLIGR
ncbi:hypothetical protein [Bacteroides sp. 14(A)]|uniref:hypothetical protein n=1 Tax=Bacteroides sp. 14(A) TaxID=1163670 RepID=UPI0004B5AACD|nr:hypothetical protein [Bacteroides sp. 14(A)]